MTATDVEGTTIHVAAATAVDGRGGTVTTTSGSLVLDLTRPSERGSEAGTDPEELFAAGYAACFDSALALAARRLKVVLGPTQTTASVSLLMMADGSYQIAVRLHVEASGCPAEALERAVAMADTMCPYSNAVRGNVRVDLTVSGSEGDDRDV